jgi:RimJ/RimL family protein N-acetyltransferase
MSISPPALPIRMVRVSGEDIDALARHIVESHAESGRGGSPHFAVERSLIRDEVRRCLEARLSRELDEPLWGRAWVLIGPRDNKIVGHLELRGGRVPSELHRATLGMGLLRALTGQGHGRRLVEVAVKWARDVADLDWIDLGVFAGNEPARRLYRRMGFSEIGLRQDAFHLDARISVDDVQMVLRLRG